MVIETKVQKNQIIIPNVYIRKYNIEPEDIVKLTDKNGGSIYIFRKLVTINEMIGAGKTSGNTNAVKLEERLYE